MVQSTQTQTNWFGGQIAEQRHGNASDELFLSSAATIQNLVVRPSGSLTRRPGTKFVAKTKNNALGLGYETSKVRLIPFVFDYESGNNYVLEIGNREADFTASSDGGLQITSAGHGLINNELIHVSTTVSDLPVGLSINTDYLVRDVTTNTFRLKEDIGGSAIAFTDTGTGTHTWHSGYIRFFKDNDILGGTNTSDGSETQLTIVGSPFNTADKLTNLQFIQSADILFFANPDVHPYKLSRTVGTASGTWRTSDGFTWTLAILDIQDGPYHRQQEDINTGSVGTTINISSTTAITSHSATRGLAFLNPNFGGAEQIKAQNAMYSGAGGDHAELSYFQVKNHGLQDGMKITLTGGHDTTSVDPHNREYYVRNATANTFRIVRSATDAAALFANDGDGATDHFVFAQYYASGGTFTLVAKDLDDVNVAMFHPNDTGRLFRMNLLKQDQVYWIWGILTVSGSVFTHTATFTLKVDCPVVQNLDNISAWKFGSFSKTNYPQNITIFQQRMVFGRNSSNPQTVWLSETGDFIGFRPSEQIGATTGETSPSGAAIIGDQILATNGMTFTFDSGTIDEIQWFLAQDKLLAGTTGGVYAIYGSEQDLTISPFNFTIKREGTQPSQTGVNATGYDNNAIYVQGTGKKIRLITFGDVGVATKSLDLTIRANDILDKKAKQVIEADIPNWISWIRLGDGSIVGLTYIPQNDVLAWHKHLIGGDYIYSATRGGDPSGHLTDDAEHAVVLDMCVIPTTTHDQIWMLVRRTISVADGGNADRIIETVEVMENWMSDESITSSKYIDGFVEDTTGTGTFSTVGHAVDNNVDTSSAHDLVVGDIIRVTTTNTLPSPLTPNTDYYVKTVVSTTEITIATISASGTSVNFTDTGTGTHTFHKRSINGLDHLQGEEVAILVDGSLADSGTVTANNIISTNSSYSTRAISGKEFTSKVITLPISLGPDGRVRIGNKKRIHRVWAKTYRTPNFKFGVYTSAFTDDDLTELVTRTTANQYGEAPHLSSENQELVPSSQGFTEGQFIIQQVDPLPLNILALEVDFETNDN